MKLGLRFPDAPCLGATDVFFIERGGANQETTRRAKQTCQTCPHILPCRQYAIDNNETFGIWGGMSEKERRRERSLQKRRKSTEAFWAAQDRKLNEAAA